MIFLHPIIGYSDRFYLNHCLSYYIQYTGSNNFCHSLLAKKLINLSTGIFNISKLSSFSLKIYLDDYTIYFVKVPCYLLLFLYPFFYPCVYPSTSKTTPIPWFCKEWRVPLNRAIYTGIKIYHFISSLNCISFKNLKSMEKSKYSYITLILITL